MKNGPLLLRHMLNQHRVLISRLAEPLAGVWAIAGIDLEGTNETPHLWRADGAFREDGRPHPLDLVLNVPKSEASHVQ